MLLNVTVHYHCAARYIAIRLVLWGVNWVEKLKMNPLAPNVCVHDPCLQQTEHHQLITVD